MKNRTKLMIGIVLISGILILSYMGSTNMVSGEEPPEQDPHDPGNARGPGIFASIPTGPIDFVSDINQILNPLIFY